ncbi:ATP-dependent DNA helicase RecQ [Virgibacillus oceani]
MYEKVNLTEILQKYFGYNSFRPGQKEIIKDIMSGEDVLGILPTGSGKSICYQLPSTLLDGSTIVVSPLISLMMDQVQQLKASNFKRVTALNSFMDKSERRQTLQQLHNYKLIYVSPELLQQEEIQQRLMKLKISLFVIDEAHCISQWGYEFRPDYLKLERIADILNRPPILALSATAPETVQKDIIQALKRPEMKKHIYPMDRENIAISIKRKESIEEKIDEITYILSRLAVPTLIYFSSRQAAEKTAAALREKLPQRIAYYHGGLEAHDRISVQQQFMHNQLDVICCTNAFGMGINKPDIRLIIHFHFPSRLEAYTQEAGRAGRDGLSSVSIILYSLQDYFIPKKMIHNELPATEDVYFVLGYLYENKEIPPTLEAIGETFKINEIQWRFLRYQLENHAIIKGNEVIANKRQISHAFNKIKAFIHNRTSTKEQKLTDMLSWLQTEGCLRKDLYKNFQPSYQNPDGPCCSNCGFTLTDWEPENFKIEPLAPQSWEHRLKKLLMIGDNNEAK